MAAPRRSRPWFAGCLWTVGRLNEVRMQPNQGIVASEKPHAFIHTVTDASQNNSTLKVEIPGGAIIASGPILSALRECREKVAVLKNVMPNSDTIHALEGFCDRLSHALREAQET